jgi:hypothetical protein
VQVAEKVLDNFVEGRVNSVMYPKSPSDPWPSVIDAMEALGPTLLSNRIDDRSKGMLHGVSSENWDSESFFFGCFNFTVGIF